jgi:hypothetical protein
MHDDDLKKVLRRKPRYEDPAEPESSEEQLQAQLDGAISAAPEDRIAGCLVGRGATTAEIGER